MKHAVEILRSFEMDERFQIESDDWKKQGFGRMVEGWLNINFENITFSIMCSYENIIFRRVTGNKNKFLQVCEFVKNIDIQISETR